MPKEHKYTQRLDTANFDIRISPTTDYGYFEHHEYGENCGGGLWFAPDKVLTDYDGVFALPQEVVRALKLAGYDVSYVED